MYCYSLYYKDKDGFELPYFENSKLFFYTTLTESKYRLAELVLSIGEKLSTEPVPKSKWWKFSKTNVKYKPMLTQYERETLQHVQKTLFVKKVKVI